MSSVRTLEHPMAAGALVLVAAGWFIVMLAEACRIPFDDPNTHLELTMIHEVMALDHSGPALGGILYASSLKLFLLEALVLSVAMPISSGNRWIDLLGFGCGLLALALVVGVVESTMARLKLVNVPKLLVSACLLCAFATIMLA
jgi:formate hydrogenlyase subunit 4